MASTDELASRDELEPIDQITAPAPVDEQPADAAPPKRIRKKTGIRNDGESGPPPLKRTTRKRPQAQPPAGAMEPDETAMDLAVTEALGLDDRPETIELETQADEAQITDEAPERQAQPAGIDEQASEGEEAPDEENRPTSFGLLFRAPEPLVKASRDPAPAEPAVAGPDEAAAPDGIPEPEPADQPDEAAASHEPAQSGSDVGTAGRRRRRRGGKGRKSRSAEQLARAAEDAGIGDESAADEPEGEEGEEAGDSATSRRRTRRRRRSGSSVEDEDAPGVVTKVREPRRERDEVTSLKGSTRLEAKKQRRREGREAGRRRTIITEAEFLARRESVERVMLVRRTGDRTQIGVLEDGVLVEHYVSRDTNVSMAGNIYLGKVQNVLPSMEAAFVDIGKGRNAVLYAGEVNWDAAGLDSGAPKRIENALESGQSVLVQVTKDPMGHKGARLTSQMSLPGRYLVYVPDSGMTGISRKLPDTERARLKRILREVVPETAGVIVRTAAEGASEADLRADVERLSATWEQIRAQAEGAGNARKGKGGPPVLLHGEADLTVRVIRDIFNEDFTQLVVSGEAGWEEVSGYVHTVAPDLADRLVRWTGEEDLFAHHRVDEQIAKAMDRKVWLPSGGSLVIDRTEAMTVIDVNTGKFVGSGGNLEETVTRNNIEAAEEIVRQLRLRDIGGIIVIDFIDMVLESNRDLVVRRLLECLGRDRTKHQVAEVTSLGLVQMTRKRVGSGLIEVFSETCEHCNGRGYLIHSEPVDRVPEVEPAGSTSGRTASRRGRPATAEASPTPPHGGPTPAQIAAAAHAAAIKSAHLAGELASLDEPQPAEADDEPQAAEADAATDRDRPDDRLPGGPLDSDETPLVWDDAPDQLGWPAEDAAGEDADGDGEVAATPAPRRRRHGRVIAPAGPPPSPE